MSTTPAPRWAATLHRLAWHLVDGREVGGRAGGPVAEHESGLMQLNVAINLHKAATGALVVGLMLACDVFTAPAWTYLAMHGSYGLVWVLKDVTAGGRRWRQPVGTGGLLATWAFLTLYWVAPVTLVLGSAGVLALGGWAPAGMPWRAAAVGLYAVGLFLMIGADVQKNTALGRGGSGSGGKGEVAGSPGGGLVTTGFFARVRHPNYLGEMMIYGSFALVVSHWLPWMILAGIWGLFFLPNMLAIEASLSRYPGYEAWRERTGFLAPKLRG